MEQESGLKVNQPASFAVSLNGAKGVIDAKVHSPSGALEECCITEIDQGKNPQSQCLVWRNLALSLLHPSLRQISTPSASSPERTASILSM